VIEIGDDDDDDDGEDDVLVWQSSTPNTPHEVNQSLDNLATIEKVHTTIQSSAITPQQPLQTPTGLRQSAEIPLKQPSLSTTNHKSRLSGSVPVKSVPLKGNKQMQSQSKGSTPTLHAFFATKAKK
jgi:hypothetical protein